MNRRTSIDSPSKRRAALATTIASVGLIVAVAACGSDDAGGGNGDTAAATGGSDAEADTVDEPTGGASDTGDTAGGRPYPLFAPSLHPGVELPAPGTAAVTVDDVTLVFETLERCEVGDASEGRAEAFFANGTTVLDDGREARFSMFRSVLVSETQAAGDSVETDSVNVWVQVEPGSMVESNTYLRGDRMEDGGRVQSGADQLPFIFVGDDDGSLSATAVAEIARFSSDPNEGAPEGLATFAVNCG